MYILILEKIINLWEDKNFHFQIPPTNNECYPLSQKMLESSSSHWLSLSYSLLLESSSSYSTSPAMSIWIATDAGINISKIMYCLDPWFTRLLKLLKTWPGNTFHCFNHIVYEQNIIYWNYKLKDAHWTLLNIALNVRRCINGGKKMKTFKLLFHG